MSYFGKIKAPGIKEKTDAKKTQNIPTGFWTKCKSCSAVLQTKVLSKSNFVCPECDHHMYMTARDRIAYLCSQAKFTEYGASLKSSDPLKFVDKKTYADRLRIAIEKNEMNDAFLSGSSSIGSIPVQIGAFEFQFMGGSMGAVVGERIVMLFENALKKKTPVVIVSASGGARMQESILSLMQMARTTSCVLKMREESLPYISILSNPTTGGVAASFAMLGDIIVAEPKALIGFAGPRVIEQSIRQKLPPGFQRAEFLLEHGFLDKVVHRKDLPSTIESILIFLMWKHMAKKNGKAGVSR